MRLLQIGLTSAVFGSPKAQDAFRHIMQPCALTFSCTHDTVRIVDVLLDSKRRVVECDLIPDNGPPSY